MIELTKGQLYKNGQKVNTYADACAIYELAAMGGASFDPTLRAAQAILVEKSPFSSTPHLISGRIENALRNPIDCSLRDIERSWLIDFEVPIIVNGKAKNLQRGYVWTQEQKNDYILHVARTRNVVGIVVCEVELKDESKVYQVIDGKQRLSTLLAFMRDKFPVMLPNGESWYFSQMPKYELLQWGRIWVRVNMLYDVQSFDSSEYKVSDEERVAVFEWLNYKATPQDAAHLQYLKS